MAGLRAGHPEPQTRHLLPWMGGSSPPMVSEFEMALTQQMKNYFAAGFSAVMAMALRAASSVGSGVVPAGILLYDKI